jgi:ubiquitin carboxyl-terminal hydrolase 4/11/15
MVFVQGYHCSRCMYTMHCRGCNVAPEGGLLLQTGDTLAVRFSEPVDRMDLAVEHPSMKLMRRQDPLSLYDCLQAFSERYISSFLVI